MQAMQQMGIAWVTQPCFEMNYDFLCRMEIRTREQRKKEDDD